MDKLVEQARALMRAGIYDPGSLYEILYNIQVVDYRVVREAIHKAKEKGI